MILWIVLLPFIAALLPVLLQKQFKLHTGWFVLPVPLIASIYFLSRLTSLQPNTIERHNWMPHIGLNLDFKMDGLSLLFALLISVIGSLVVFYSISYLNKRQELGKFYTYLLLFMGAMLGVVLSDNILALYMFYELTSISSFLLIAFWYFKEKSVQGALKSMLITVFGGLMLLGAIAILVNITQTTSISEMIQQSSHIQDHALFTLASGLILLAAFTKSAQFPFHIWLPDAMEAPTPVSAYLHSATMVKAGIYVIARFTPIFAVNTLWYNALIFTGLFTMCFASIKAVNQKDLKGILAFSTISQLGLIMSLLGIGSFAYAHDFEGMLTIAVTASVFHILNHASFKGALFMAVGIIDHETGTRDIRKLNGLLSFMPITFTISLLGLLSMAGIPPFNGFLSKEMFITSVMHVAESGAMPLIGIIVIILLMFVGSTFTFIYCIKLLKDIFFGPKEDNQSEKVPHEAGPLLLTSPIVLITIMLIISVVPNLFLPLLNQATASILNQSVNISPIHHFHGLNIPLFITLSIIIIGTLLLYTLKYWDKAFNLFPAHISLNNGYKLLLTQSQKKSKVVNQYLVHRTIRFSMSAILMTLILMTFYVFLNAPVHIDFTSLGSIQIYEMILVGIILIATIMILKAQSRLFSIIMLSAIGYSIALLFVFFDAPDLALTQLSIETISTALFLMCFYHLPRQYRHEESARFKLSNLFIALLSGICVTIIAFAAYSHKLYPSIAEYYIKNVYELAAGKNMVNVILVDFRGFDTLFESSVLGIAGIGIYTLIRLRKNRGEINEKTK
ncbi:Na+/H+ antiporter subunit A [Macrococcoides caseolyticum]|uniref:Na+/H+ antiporter subunit A n=1 Tax=Macrococcoides caseolyticum TaxID=69966 RepID=UPI001F33254E|nr:Na+/H+ antiporter subunit A [Macrococcus caseolyticus]MCE4955771.1 Na+/H+ antiporter subunit A [Macrococcus caseolyticus]